MMQTTTLAKEKEILEGLIAQRILNYQLPNFSFTCEKALKVIFAHRNKSVKLDKETVNDLNIVADYYIERDEPIVITVSLAVSRIPNPLKFIEDTPYPTYSWMHLAWYFKLINEKVKLFYPPGIKLFIFDEATLFAELLGMDEKGIAKCIDASRKIFKVMDAPVEIVEMTKDMFPDNIQPEPTTPDRIYAMACSIPEMQNEEVMKELYRTKDRDYNEKRKIMGEKLWKRSEHIVGMVNATLAWRKKLNMFGDYLEGRPYIDSCITQKDQRLVLAVSSCALINHGLPVLERNTKYKMVIVPEIRISEEYKNAEPVMLSANEFGGPDSLYTFYYINSANGGAR